MSRIEIERRLDGFFDAGPRITVKINVLLGLTLPLALALLLALVLVLVLTLALALYRSRIIVREGLSSAASSTYDRARSSLRTGSDHDKVGAD